MNEQLQKYLASIVNDKRFSQLKLWAYENQKSWPSRDASEDYGKFMGLYYLFKSMEEAAGEITGEELKSVKKKKNSENLILPTTDPDLDETPDER